MNWREILERAEPGLIALGMVAWPILGKYSRATGPWVGFLVMSGAAIVLALFARMQGQFGRETFPAANNLILLALAGALNGLAMYFYTARTSSQIQTGKYVVLVAMLVIVEAPFVDLLLNKAWLTPRQLAGVGCGIASIYLLNQK